MDCTSTRGGGYIEGHLLKAQARTFKNIITSLIPQVKLGLAQVEEEAFKSKAKAAIEGL
jgi:hypothetical protein